MKGYSFGSHMFLVFEDPHPKPGSPYPDVDGEPIESFTYRSVFLVPRTLPKVYHIEAPGSEARSFGGVRP